MLCLAIRNFLGFALGKQERICRGEPEAEDFYRPVTTLQPEIALAAELAALYAERWETFDKLKTHLRGSRVVLRSKTPQLLLQEFYRLLLAHFAVHSLIR